MSDFIVCGIDLSCRRARLAAVADRPQLTQFTRTSEACHAPRLAVQVRDRHATAESRTMVLEAGAQCTLGRSAECAAGVRTKGHHASPGAVVPFVVPC